MSVIRRKYSSVVWFICHWYIYRLVKCFYCNVLNLIENLWLLKYYVYNFRIIQMYLNYLNDLIKCWMKFIFYLLKVKFRRDRSYLEVFNIFDFNVIDQNARIKIDFIQFQTMRRKWKNTFFWFSFETYCYLQKLVWNLEKIVSFNKVGKFFNIVTKVLFNQNILKSWNLLFLLKRLCWVKAFFGLWPQSAQTSLQFILCQVAGFYESTIPQSPPSHLRDYTTCNNARFEFSTNFVPNFDPDELCLIMVSTVGVWTHNLSAVSLLP